MKLREKSFNVSLRLSILCALAIGVPKFFFVLHSQEEQKKITHEALLYTHSSFNSSNGINYFPCENTTIPQGDNYPLKSSFARTSTCCNNTSKHSVTRKKSRTPLAKMSVWSGKRVALVTNQMHRWGVFPTMLERLVARGMKVRTLLVPFVYQSDFIREKMTRTSFIERAIPIIMGETHTLFSRKNLVGCDALCLDLQDTGMRTDSSLAVVYAALRAARDFKKELIILDHPNPLGGSVEGGCFSGLKMNDLSLFLARIPLRHGMTLGELARYMNRSFTSLPARVTVIPLIEYDRFVPRNVRTISLPFSRNIRSLEACRCHSFLGLLEEIAPFDVALGTRYAYQALLLPEKKTLSRAAWEAYRLILKKHAVESRLWRYYNKRKKRWFFGVRISISQGVDFSSMEILVETLSFFKKRGIALMPSAALDKILGKSLLRQFIDDEQSFKKVLDEMRKESALFLKEAFESCLYKPMPQSLCSAKTLRKKVKMSMKGSV